MKMHRTKKAVYNTSNIRRDYYRTYVIIPKYIREAMGLTRRRDVYISLDHVQGERHRNSRITVRGKRAHIDDMRVTLSQHRTREYKGNTYYTVRMTIPGRLAGMLKIDRDTDVEFVHTGNEFHIKFTNP